tara:strand:- start:30392 stop:30898 length:507 start_codon:yes stop_codon:yes gene_type:complete
MNGLITNYFSVIHDKQSLLFSYAKNLLTKNVTKAQEVFDFIHNDLVFFILWEERVLLPLFEDKESPLFETYPTYSLHLEVQHIKILIKYINEGFLQLTIPMQAHSATNKLTMSGSVETLISVFDELEGLLQQIYIKKESLYFPIIDEALTKEELAELFVTMTYSDATN